MLRIVELLEKLHSDENKKKVLHVIGALGESSENKMEIGMMQ